MPFRILLEGQLGVHQDHRSHHIAQTLTPTVRQLLGWCYNGRLPFRAERVAALETAAEVLASTEADIAHTPEVTRATLYT